MARYDVIDLIREQPVSHGVMDPPEEVRRTVYAEIRSVSRTEAYRAMSLDMEPVYTFVLADPAEYEEEPFAEYKGKRYRISRTYVAGQKIELTAVR